MAHGSDAEGLRLTEEEAFSLLGLCLTSPNGLDKVSERALRKLAEYCTSRTHNTDNHIERTVDFQSRHELGKAGA